MTRFESHLNEAKNDSFKVTVILKERKKELEHLENAFRLQKDYYVAKCLAREISRLRGEYAQISALVQ